MSKLLTTDALHPSSPSECRVVRHRPLFLRLVTLFIAITALLSSMSLIAQDITYSYEPEYQLGEELWSIPISGEMTLSQDGTRLLIASLVDTTFYVVDALTGEIQRKLPAWYFSNPTTTFYTDPELTRLWVQGVDSTRKMSLTTVIDITTGKIIHQLEERRIGSAISPRQDRILEGKALYELGTYDVLWVYDESAAGWFDDERGVFYRITNRLLTEYDGATGQPIRQIGMEATRGFVRRPKNSDWIYVFASDMTTATASNWVLAFHADSGERVTFKEFYNHGVPITGAPDMTNRTCYVGTNDQEAFSSGVAGIAGVDLQPIWLFDADAKHVRTLLNPIFTYVDRKLPKESQIDLDRLHFVHCWPTDWQDSAITRCNQLIPAITGISERPASQAVWLQVTSGELIIDLAEGDQARSIDIANLQGQQVMHLDGASLQPRPIRIPTASLGSGTYVCVLELGSRTLSSTFSIAR